MNTDTLRALIAGRNYAVFLIVAVFALAIVSTCIGGPIDHPVSTDYPNEAQQ